MSGVLHGMFLAGSGSTIESDAYPNNTKLLLKVNADGTFTDASTSSRTITGYNGVTTSTSVAKFNQRSASFDGSNDYLSIADSIDWDLWDGSSNLDFTVEGWFYLNSTAQITTLIGNYPGWILQYRNDTGATASGKGWVFGYGNAQLIVRDYDTATTWVHVAVTRNGTNLRMFFDGVQQGATVTNSTQMFGSDQTLDIGRLGGGINVQYFNGYLQDVRFTNGVARYTANFTTPGRLT